MARTKKRFSKVDKYIDLLGCVKDRYIIEKTGVTMPAVSRYRKKKGIKAFKHNIKTAAASIPGISGKAADATIAKRLDLPLPLVAVCRRLPELQKDKEGTIEKYDLLLPVVEAIMGEKAFQNKVASTKKRRVVKTKTKSKKKSEPKLSTEPSATTSKVVTEVEEKEKTSPPKEVILINAYECFVSQTGEESSFYTTAVNFQEAAQKFEAAHAKGAIKGDLVRIRLMGAALA